MRLKISRIYDGPQLSDNLNKGAVGFDLASFGLAGGAPGDTTFFDLFISIEASEEERELFDYVDYVSFYVRSTPTYTGGTSAQEDFLDILELGDMGYGLAIKNPLTGEYDIQIDSSNFSTESGKLLLPKEMAIYQDRSNLSQITNITREGFDDTALASGSTLYTVKTASNRFTESMVGLRIFNKTLSDSAVITAYVSPTEVIVEKQHGWATGNLIYIKRLAEPHDGVIALKTSLGDILGNAFKLECRYSLPTDYRRTNIKQFNIEITSGSEGGE